MSKNKYFMMMVAVGAVSSACVLEGEQYDVFDSQDSETEAAMLHLEGQPHAIDAEAAAAWELEDVDGAAARREILESLAMRGSSDVEDGVEDEAWKFSRQIEIDDKRYDLPVVEIEVLPGVEASFYVWQDLSAAFKLQAEIGGRGIEEERLEGLTVAEVFWALSEPGVEIPDALLRHHEAMVRDDGHSTWDEVVREYEQGWLKSQSTHAALAACNNFTFYANNCLVQSPWVGSHCYLDSAGHHATDIMGSNKFGTFRFRAAMCADGGGSVYDSLEYYRDCGANSEFGIPWIGIYSSPAHLVFTWIAPSGGSFRRWRHTGFPYHSPGVRDWSSKWGPLGFCF